MISTAELTGLLSGSTVLGAAITAVAMRRPSMAKVFADNYRDVIERLTKVEARLDTVESELLAEKAAHSATKDLLRSALRHIREFTAWLNGPRHSDAPTTPTELLKEL